MLDNSIIFLSSIGPNKTYQSLNKLFSLNYDLIVRNIGHRTSYVFEKL